MRFNAGETDESYGERLIIIALRMLQDCPATGITLRRVRSSTDLIISRTDSMQELMVVFRHLMGLPARKALFPVLNKLFNEDVLLGTGVGSKEMLRAAVYSAIADLVHHIRNELDVNQLRRIIEVYSGLIHNPTLGNNIHTLSTKMIFGLIEQVDKRETKEGAINLLGAIFETSLERLEALAIVYEEVVARNALLKADPSQTVLDAAFIEKSRPVGGAVYSQEKTEDMLQGLFCCDSFHITGTCSCSFRGPADVQESFTRLSSMSDGFAQTQRPHHQRRVIFPTLCWLHSLYGTLRPRASSE